MDDEHARSSSVMLDDVEWYYRHYKYHDGNRYMYNSIDYFYEGMAACDQDTQDVFKSTFDSVKAFIEDEETDWKEVAQANYNEEQEFVDEQWFNYIKEWDLGVYFSAGMFYGRVYGVLSASPSTF